MIGLDPDIVWRCQGDRAEINRDGADRRPPLSRPAPRRRSMLCARSSPNRGSMQPEDLPPMAAGVFGYLGYDMVRQMERLPPAKPDPIGVPDAIMLRPTIMVVFDSVTDEIFVVTPVRPEPSACAKAAYEHGLRADRGDRRRRSKRRCRRARADLDADRADCKP